MPLGQHVPLQVVPRQLQPSSGFPEQLIQSGAHWLWQVPLTHDGVEKQCEHFVPQPPQLLGSVWVSTHAPLQSVVPLGHAQVPLEQVAPVGHAVPQAPQLCGSLASVTQALPHKVCPAGHVMLMQCPDLHVFPEAHAWWQEPQWWASRSRFTHFPAHRL